MVGSTISHYRGINTLGGGGMGVVYEAEDVRLGRHVALKFVAETLSKDPQAVQRFTGLLAKIGLPAFGRFRPCRQGRTRRRSAAGPSSR